MNWKDVPLPDQMKDLPRDPRGYPVPFIILVDEQGTYHFRINDTEKVDIVLEKDLCAICAKKLNENKWLIGGPGSAFHRRGVFIDTPTHYECGTYALKVCPYLVFKEYQYAKDPAAKLRKMSENVKNEEKKYLTLMDPTVDPQHPEMFAVIKIAGINITRPNKIQRYITPFKPYLKTEFWSEGEQVTSFNTIVEMLKNAELDLNYASVISKEIRKYIDLSRAYGMKV